MTSSDDLDRLLAEAGHQPFAGWDFSWLGARMRSRPLPWDFTGLVVDRARESPDLLDLGTGGGERLSRLSSRPARTVATEAWTPNVAVAARRLRPLGIPVVQVEGAPDNVAQAADETRGRLPFRTARLDLVTSRHESYVASEVARVLVPGGRFLTQQVGQHFADDCHRLLGLPVPSIPEPAWRLPFAVAQVEAAGLHVLSSDESDQLYEFLDVGALAWYLKSIPWAVPSFTIDAFRPRLAELHDQIEAAGPLIVRLPHFWLDAQKPDS